MTSPGAVRSHSARSPSEVLESHLRLAADGSTEEDIRTNYAEDVILLTGLGSFRGHDGARESRAILGQDLPGARFEYLTVLVEGDYGFLEWRGISETVEILDGADGFVFRDGLIVAQTIHYTVRHRPGVSRQIRHVATDD